MWCVVNFIEANDIEVVPESWLETDTFECWWPCVNSDKLKRLIERCAVSNSADYKWKLYKARKIGHTYDSLEIARKKLNLAQYKSDLTSDVNSSPEGKGKRRKVRRVLTSDEESDDMMEVTPMESQVYRGLDEPSTSSALPRRSPRKANTVFSTKTKISSPKNKSLSSKTTVSRQLEKSFSNSKKERYETASPRTEMHSTEFEKTIIRKINMVHNLLRTQGDQLDSLAATLQKLVLQSEDKKEGRDISVATDLLPCDNLEDLLELESILEHDKEVEKELSKHLARLGGTSVGDCTRRCLRATVSDKVAIEYSWVGQKGKKVFSSLQLKNVIMRAVSLAFPTGTTKEVEDSIKTWLRPAKTRLESKEKVRKEKADTATGAIEEDHLN